MGKLEPLHWVCHCRSHWSKTRGGSTASRYVTIVPGSQHSIDWQKSNHQGTKMRWTSPMRVSTLTKRMNPTVDLPPGPTHPQERPKTNKMHRQTMPPIMIVPPPLTIDMKNPARKKSARSSLESRDIVASCPNLATTTTTSRKESPMYPRGLWSLSLHHRNQVGSHLGLILPLIHVDLYIR